MRTFRLIVGSSVITKPIKPPVYSCQRACFSTALRGCGKTQIAKTLSAEGGLNFIVLDTSDCKQKWLGGSAEKLKTVFAEARTKQPSLIFIDELDAVCP